MGVLAAALAIAAHAQTSRGTVSGTVTDPSGAVAIRASVALTQTETGVRRSTTTNEDGIYRFEAVDLGLVWTSQRTPQHHLITVGSV
jgi:hypothetical protein